MVMVMATSTAAAATTTTLTLNLSLSLNHKRPHLLSIPHPLHHSTLPSFSKTTIIPTTKSRPKFHLHASPSPQNPSNSDSEEIRWLREEQRWLREEQRWLREESRWRSERESLLRELSQLKLQIQALDGHKSLHGAGASISDTISNVAAMLQMLKDVESGSIVGRIAESGSSATPMVLETTGTGKEEKAAAVVVKDIRVVEGIVQGEGKKVERKALRKGSEGEEVRLMQAFKKSTTLLARFCTITHVTWLIAWKRAG